MLLLALLPFLALIPITSCNSVAHAGPQGQAQQDGAPALSETRAEWSGRTFPLFPPPSGDLVLEAGPDGEVPTLLDLLLRYGELTGQEIAFNASHREETRSQLERARIPLERPTTVPAAEVQTFVEELLAENFLLTLGATDSPRVVYVHPLKSPARTQLRAQSIHVSSGDFARLRGHPAVLFTVLVDLPHLDVRTVANSLRALVVDPNLQTLVPLGASTLVVTSTGPWIADLVEQLQHLDSIQPRIAESDGIVHELVRLRHAPADQVAPLLQAAFPGALVQRYPHLQALLITCPEERLAELGRLIALLDVEATPPD